MVVDAGVSQIPVGVDGEALVLDTPVRCTVQPAALRVRVPRDRPGVPDPQPIISKLIRVCTQDPNFYSYTEAPLECEWGGNTYNLIQAKAATATNPKLLGQSRLNRHCSPHL